MEKKIYSLTLESTIYTIEQLEARADTGAVNIAMAGRSNVGKSSLINALAGSKQLAKVSSTPGKTASINYYRVNPSGFYIVDLPGYGYAQKSKTERAKWAGLIDAYLNRSKDLSALAILLDCRLEPQTLDLDLIAYANKLGLQIVPILTKADKCKQRERSARVSQWINILHGIRPIVTSSTGPAMQRIGLDSLWAALDDIGLANHEADATLQ